MIVRRAARRLLGRGRVPRTEADQRRLHDLLSPDRCTLLVVDVQNDFVDPDGRVGPGRARGAYAHALTAINSLIKAARTTSVPVVFIRTEHDPATDSAPYRAVRARRRRLPEGTCLTGSWGADFPADLEPPRDDELVVTKHGYDGFATGELASHLATIGRDAVVVCGVATTLCVAATVAGAFEHGLFAIVPREATAASDMRAAQATLRRIDVSYGDVVPLDLVLEAWRTGQATV